jgi:hypothetical protein
MHYRGTSSFHKCFDLNYTRKAIEILLLSLKDYELASLFFDNARDITVLHSRTSRKFNQQNVSSCPESRKTFCAATENARQKSSRHTHKHEDGPRTKLQIPALLCPDDSFTLPLMAVPGSHECNEANDAIIDGIIIPRSRGEEEAEENRIEAR